MLAREYLITQNELARPTQGDSVIIKQTNHNQYMESVDQDEMTKNKFTKQRLFTEEIVVSKRFSRHHWKPHAHIVFTSTRDSCFNLFTTRHPAFH